MKALVYTGPKQMEIRELEDTQPVDGEVLIRVDSVGICGSDMHAFLGHDERRPAPLILGHEAAGEIISGPNAGQRVTVNPLVACGKCEFCQSERENLCPNRQIISMPPREGAFAQFISMPERNLVKIPDSVSDDHAALAEPIACGWHAVRLAKNASSAPLADSRTLVIGGGAIGVGAALSLQAAGAKDVLIVEPNSGRRDYLNETAGLNAVDTGVFTDKDQFDIVVDAVGFSATRLEASERAKPGGVIVHIGLGQAEGGLNIRRMTLQEITFIGTYTYTMADFHETAQAIFDGRLGPLDWLEKRPLDDGFSAFNDLLSGKVSAPKIILKPN
ncbi:MAG: zinc-dependent alcohol dehydrogenase [Rhizobiaceae bacterium]